MSVYVNIHREPNQITSTMKPTATYPVLEICFVDPVGTRWYERCLMLALIPWYMLQFVATGQVRFGWVRQ